ncbi:transcription initiation factor IIB 3 [Halobacteriales archaeon QS_3_64_16]|nr:MAG: transcription initiation factor IIB 3 [Halobacteriales archaeon QS_3_64_16]
MRSPTLARSDARTRERTRAREQDFDHDHQDSDREGESGDREQSQEPSLDRPASCPECESATVERSANGEFACGECGLVVAENEIDRSPEWRAYGSQERRRKSRVGAPATRRLHDEGLTTAIDPRDADAAGRALPERRREQVSRLWQWHERIRTSEPSERTLQFGLGEIDRMASALGLDRSTREVASVLFRRALADDLIRGRSIEAVATAVLYAACRSAGIARSLEEVTAVSRIERTPVGRTYRYLARELGLELEPVDPKEFVPRFRSALGLTESVERAAEEVINATAAQGLLSGKSPTGFAAGAIYIAGLLCDQYRTQKEIASAAGVTTATVRNHYKAQVDALELSTGDDLSKGSPALLGQVDDRP